MGDNDHRFLSIALPPAAGKAQIQSFEGVEELGRPFEYSVDILTEKELEPKSLIAELATVKLRQSDGKDRFFNGHISRIVHQPRRGRMFRYRMTLVPWLWFFTRQADCRLFHKSATLDMLKKVKVPDIVQEIWKEGGFNLYKSKLQTSYPERELTVQYRETTFNFVSRLMEHEGIYYYFEHDEGKHTLVLCDSPSNHEPRKGSEKFLWDPTPTGLTVSEHLSEWVVSREMHTTKTALVDFDFTKPKTPLREPGSFPREVEPVYEVYDYPGEFTEKAEGERLAKTRAEELGGHYMTIHVTGTVRGAAPGSKFTLTGAVRPDQKGEFLIVSATYRATNDIGDSGQPIAGSDAFTCTMTVRPAADQFRPARITPRPVISGPQTAIIVGADGDEIHTDQEGYGRVKVKFHWDRYSKMDQNASPWIRVAQVWAGKKWGAMFIPRVGHEVIVEYLDGDPDRPLITGRVYNNENMPPYELPAHKTMSTIKSSSSTGGDGFNEIRLEDNKGHEQVFIHAEKNMDVRVKNDSFQTILNNKHVEVVKDAHEWVKNDRHELVDRDHREEIKRDRNLTVDGKEAKEVKKSLSLKVGEDVIEEFGKNHSSIVTKDLLLKADNICIDAGTNITIKVGDQYIAIDSSGIKLGSKGKISLESDDEMSLKTTGFLSADLKAEAGGNLELKGILGFSADGTLKSEIKAIKTSVEGTGKLEFSGGKASMEGKSGLELSGATVKIG